MLVVVVVQLCKYFMCMQFEELLGHRHTVVIANVDVNSWTEGSTNSSFPSSRPLLPCHGTFTHLNKHSSNYHAKYVAIQNSPVCKTISLDKEICDEKKKIFQLVEIFNLLLPEFIWEDLLSAPKTFLGRHFIPLYSCDECGGACPHRNLEQHKCMANG